LGEAWQSVDVFVSLSQALARDKDSSYLAFAAQKRAEELINSGKKSLAPGASTGQRLKNEIDAGYNGWIVTDKPTTQREFQELRAEADEWQAQRTAYMEAKMEAGEHPDTHPNFWGEWEEPVKPEIYGSPVPAPRQYWLLLGGVLVLSLFILQIANRKRHRRAA
jgi:hypothetical protein